MHAIDLWWMDIGDLPEHGLSHGTALLDPEERARAERFRFAADRRQFIAAHWLARSLLASRLGCDARAIRFRRETGGRPELTDHPDWRFSLSHTRGLVACALTRHDPVGLDAERGTAGLDVGGIARSCFAPNERALVSRGGRDAFLRLWTLKEAFLKATGEGFARPLDSFSFSLDPPRLDDPPAGKPWSFAEVGPFAGHRVSIAVGRAGKVAAALNIRPIVWSDLCAPTVVSQADCHA